MPSQVRKIASTYAYFGLFIFTVSVFFMSFFNSIGENDLLIGVNILLLSATIMYQYRNNSFLLFIWLFISYSNYSIVSGIILNPDELSYFTTLRNNESNHIAIMAILLFLFTVFVLNVIFYKENINIFYLDVKEKSNISIAYGTVFILILILLFGFTRPDVVGERGQPSAMYEYSLIFFILGIYYSKKNPFFRKSYVILAVLFSVQNFLFGGRIIGLQIILTVFLMLNTKKVSTSKIITIAFTSLVFFTFIGIVRENSVGLKGILGELTKRNFALDTAISAFYTSNTFILYKIMIPFHEQMHLFQTFLVSIFTGGKHAIDGNLAMATRPYFIHYYGGIFPIWFYFWGGYLGVVISGVVCYLLSKINTVINNDFFKLVLVYLASKVPRWYLYTPLDMFRGILIFSIVFGICYLINKVLSSRKEGKYVK